MDRLVMYKSKSGNHLSKMVQKDIEKGDRHRKRRDKRQTTTAKSLKNYMTDKNYH